jgi:DNA end-binding protein Ku
MKATANTTIKFALINLPVQVFQAVESGNEVTFKMACPEGGPVTQVYVDQNGAILTRSELQKGIFSGGDFFPIDPADLDAIAEATKLPDLDILEVIDADEFWDQAHRITGHYYIGSHPKTGSLSAFRLFVDALEAEGKVAVTKWTARSRQSLMVMWPKDGMLVASTMSFAGDMREPENHPPLQAHQHPNVTYTDTEREMAGKLLEMLSQRSTALAMEVDEALTLKHDLVEQALGGTLDRSAVKADVQPKKNADLAEALAASLAAIKAPA